MINVLVTLEVLDFDCLALFESKAAAIMRDYGGQFVCAFEVCRSENNAGREIHILEFPSESMFLNYRLDERLKAMEDLRSKAIRSTEVAKLGRSKSYA